MINKKVAITALFVFLVGAPAMATVLGAGASGASSDFGLAGTVLHEQRTNGVVSTPVVSFQGDFAHAVLDVGGGELAFLYQFFSDDSSIHDVLRVTVSRFGGLVTDVGHTASVPLGTTVFSSGGKTPTGASRSGGAGDVIRWDFDGISHGHRSKILVVIVEADVFVRGGSFTAQNGGVAGVNTMNPVAVPEPGTYALMGAGLLALGFIRRKK